MYTILILLLLVIVLLIVVSYIIKNYTGKGTTGELGSAIGKNVGTGVVSTVSGVVQQIGKELELNTKREGESCKTHGQCVGWEPGKAGTLACCNEKCTKLQRDWAGVGYCPDECKDAPAPLGGRCDRGYSWKRKEGEPCDTNISCEGWVAGKAGTLACCNGTCTKQKRDWAGVGYCPHECVGQMFGRKGSCS